MQKTIENAREYAQLIADLRNEARVIVLLPESSRSERGRLCIHGDYYGGVTLAELAIWEAMGSRAIETVYPSPRRESI